jgi:hypothetical protein
MALQPKRVIATLKQNPNLKVTKKTKDHLGASAVCSSNDVEARVLGIPGEKGDPGMVWMGEYNPQTTYQKPHAVEYDGSAYVYIHETPSNQIPTNPAYWDLVASKGDRGIPGLQGPIGPPGLIWMGEYNQTTQYQKNNAVSYLGSSYIYISDQITNEPPTNTLYWDVLAQSGTSTGDDKSFVFHQNVAESLWIVPHNLSKFPSVTVVDSGGTEVEGDVSYTDPNNLQIVFSAPFTGKAYLN